MNRTSEANSEKFKMKNKIKKHDVKRDRWGEPVTDITRKLKKLGLRFHDCQGVCWYSKDVRNPSLCSLGPKFIDSIRIDYDFERKGHESYLVDGLFGWLGEYHLSRDKEEVNVWMQFDGFDQEELFRSLGNSLRYAEELAQKGVPFKRIYHLIDCANVSREDFITRIRGTLQMPWVVLEAINKYRNIEGVNLI